MNLKTENIIEFLINDEFINFILHPTLKLQLKWDVFFRNNPELMEAADQARMILFQQGEIYELQEWETNEIKKRIISECGIPSLN